MQSKDTCKSGWKKKGKHMRKDTRVTSVLIMPWKTVLLPPPALLQALAQLAVRVMQRARISSTPTCKEKRKKEKRKKKAWAEEVEHLVRDWDS